MNGVRVVFNDLKKDQDQYQLRVTVFTDPNNPAVWEELQPAMTQRIRLYDARGQALETHGLGNSGGSNNQVEMTLMFGPSLRPEDGKTSGEPVRMAHLGRAARTEYAKLEKPPIEAELGVPS